MQQSKYETGIRVMYTVPSEKGSPMFYGRIVRKHWHSQHVNERTGADYWTYTVVTESAPDRAIHENHIIEVKDL